MQQYHPPIYVLAFCTLLTTLVLIFVGGLVTGTDAGMAVPDWPTTFGDNMFLYPLSQMVSGLLVWIPDDLATNLGQGILTKPIQEALNIDENILSSTSTVQVVEKDQAWKIHDPVADRFYTILRQEDRLGVYVHGVLFEHSHRLLGTLVGLLTIATTISIWIYNSVKQLKWISALALLAVIIQGLLGGLRVIENSIVLAIIHASFAPISLAFFTSLVLLTSKKWSQSPPTTDVSQVHRLAIFASGLIYVQLILGAILRQTAQHLSAHILVAILVAMHIILIVRRVFLDMQTFSGFVGLAMLMGSVVILQMALGIGAWYSEFQLGERMPYMLRTAVTSGHHFLGVLLFMLSFIFTLDVLRHPSGETTSSGLSELGQIKSG